MERVKAESPSEAGGQAGVASNLGELEGPHTLDPKSGRQREEITAIVCGPPNPGDMHMT